MATGPSAASAQNVFIPNWEASGKLAVGFSRNPSAFPFPKYTQYVKSPKIRGYYLKFNNQRQGRVIDIHRNAWPWGQPRPAPSSREQFRFVEFELARYDEPYGLDLKTIEQADFKVDEVERKSAAQLLMTERCKRGIATLTNTGNWTAATDGDLTTDHTSTATSLASGKFDVGSDSTPYLLHGVNKAMINITLDTMGKLGSVPGKYYLVMNPTDAERIAASPEIVSYIKGSPTAYAQVTGNLHPNSKYGLPPTIYGAEIVIDDTVEVTSNDGATLVRGFVWPTGTIAMLYRQGELEGVYGEQSFSSFVMFHDSDMVVEEFTDERNKLWEGHVMEEAVEVVACPASGWLFTSATG